MELRIYTNFDSHSILYFNEVSVNLKYQSILDTFQFKVYFNPDSSTDRLVFKPAMYYTCEVYHNDILLITGTILSHSFKSNEDANWVLISGYSKSGVFEDCYLPPVNGVNQTWSAGATLYQVTSDICKLFGIGLDVDDIVVGDCNKPYNHPINYVTEGNHPTIKKFLVDLAAEHNVIISHQPNGNVLLTRTMVNESKPTQLLKPESNLPIDFANQDISNGTKSMQSLTRQLFPVIVSNSQKIFSPIPVFDFTFVRGQGNYPATEMDLQFNGQKMFTDIFVVGQKAIQYDQIGIPTNESGNSVDNSNSPLNNPYVPKKSFIEQGGTFRPVIEAMEVGDDNTVQNTARAKLGADLQGMTCTIQIKGWTLTNPRTGNEELARPNTIVTITNKELYLFAKSKWFVTEVNFNGNEKGEWATLVCVLPDCYSMDDVTQNVFNLVDTDSNLGSFSPKIDLPLKLTIPENPPI